MPTDIIYVESLVYMALDLISSKLDLVLTGLELFH